MKITILVATVSQTAAEIAKSIAFEFSPEYDIDIRLFDNDTTIDILTPERLWLICSSTYDIGNIPENAASFYNSLLTTPKALTDINYAVIALGDSTYTATYANGGKQLDAALQDLGANRIGEICVLDASSDEEQEQIALQWFNTTIAANHS